jgi:hypothetical protein
MPGGAVLALSNMFTAAEKYVERDRYFNEKWICGRYVLQLVKLQPAFLHNARVRVADQFNSDYFFDVEE